MITHLRGHSRNPLRSIPQQWRAAGAVVALAVISVVPNPTVVAQSAAGAVDLICAPRAALLEPPAPLRIVGSNAGPLKRLFGPGEQVVVNGGSDRSLKPGQEFFVRRVFTARTQKYEKGREPIGIHTAGWIRLTDVGADHATATILHACDGLMLDDYLEEFSAPPPAAPLSAGEPDFNDVAIVLFGDEYRMSAGAPQHMVISRGSGQGVQLGQRLTIFRRTLGPTGPIVRIAEATAVIVQPETATVRIDRVHEAVTAGDLAALHK